MLYFLQARTLLCHEALTKRKRIDRGSQQTSCHMWFLRSEASFSPSANSLFLHNVVLWNNIRGYVIFEECGIATLYPLNHAGMSVFHSHFGAAVSLPIYKVFLPLFI